MSTPELYVQVPSLDLPDIEIGPSPLSGEAAFAGLKKAVEELSSLAPADQDVLISAFNITVREVRFLEPHTFLFSGLDDNGHHAHVVIHFSQLVARVTYRPKQAQSRVITGFARVPMMPDTASKPPTTAP